MKFPQTMFANLEHFFQWCDLQERQWRARVRINQKEARAQQGLAKFHAKYPGHVVSIAEYRQKRRANLAKLRIEEGYGRRQTPS